MLSSASKLDPDSILAQEEEDVRAKRVWSLLNVMFATWLFFCTYFVLTGYYAAAKIGASQFLVYLVINGLLQRKKKDFLLVLTSYLICSAIGIAFTAVSHPNLWLASFFFPVSILVSANLFGTRQSTIWFVITCLHFIWHFCYRCGIHEAFTGHFDQLISALGVAFCIYFCCQQAEADFQRKTKNLVDLGRNLQNRSDELEELATTDSLTGLMNRFQFQNELEGLVETATRDKQVALFLVDMDGFKEINDTLGHAKGDQVLVEVGKRLSKKIGHLAHVARLGGDEFCILFDEIQHDAKAYEIGWEIHNLLVERYNLSDIEVTLGTSVGFALCPKHTEDSTDMLSFADTAMYHAKKSKQRVTRYEPEMTSRLRENRVSNERLAVALEQEEFQLVYQPLVNTVSGKMYGAEALLRWHRDGKQISPAHFVPLLESTGRIVPVSKWIISEACRQLAQWRALGTDFIIAINISPLQFRDDDFIDSILHPLEVYNIDPSQIELEITEGILIENVAEVIDKLLQVRELGCRISIDDFGTGYSSLAYLRQFPINKLKIDRAFVKDIPDSDDGVIAKSIIMLASQLGLDVLAEGIETVEQLEFLVKNGCDKFQGYYFARPSSPEELFDMVTKSSEFLTAQSRSHLESEESFEKQPAS